MFPRFFLLSTTVKRSISSTAYEYPSFLSSFLLSPLKYQVFFSTPPNLYQPTKFPPQNTSKSESPNFRTHPMRSPKPHAYPKYLISKPLFPNIFPSKTSKPHSRREFTKYPSALSDEKKKKRSVSSLLCPYGEIFETIFPVDTDNEKSEVFNRASELVGIDKHPQKTGLISPAPRISILPTSQISKPVLNVLTTDMRHFWTIPPLSEISKISNRNSNLQLSPIKTSLTSTWKFSFIKKHCLL